jgi:hypothetical protein
MGRPLNAGKSLRTAACLSLQMINDEAGLKKKYNKKLM